MSKDILNLIMYLYILVSYYFLLGQSLIQTECLKIYIYTLYNVYIDII